MIDFENALNPFDDRREAIQRWRIEAVIDVAESEEVLAIARRIAGEGLRSQDALHVACAMAARCDVFLTTDRDVLKKMKGSRDIIVLSPTEFVGQVD